MFDPKKYPFCAKGHKYAEDIISGKIVASKFVIGTCNRYMRDLDDPRFTFNADKAERYLKLVQKFEHVIGEWKTKNIVFMPWQCFIWMNIIGFISNETGYRRFRIAHVEIARGNSKAFSLDTPVPTPEGMKLWGDVGIGSKLFDRNGNICSVIGKNPIHFPKARKITFSNGESLITSDKHLWFTADKNQRRYKKWRESVKNTEEIFDTLEVGGGSNHAIKVSNPVLGREIPLPIDPYILGYWIGNGESRGSRIHCHAKDLTEVSNLFTSKGIKVMGVRKSTGNGAWFTQSTVVTALKKGGLYGNKHIPKIYLTSSYSQRLELLRGLMDSDGNISKKGQAFFSFSNPELLDGVKYLISSLGYKYCFESFKSPPNNNFKSDKTHYRISFYPRGEVKVFHLKRKSDRQISKQGEHSYQDKIYIKNIEKLEPIYPMFCVEVDSPDKSYLIGNTFIPTHNSTQASQAALYFLALDGSKGNQIAAVATKKDQARIVLDGARAMARKASAFRSSTGVKVFAHSIIQESTDSKMRAMSSDSTGLDGLNEVLAICDELHAMQRSVFEVIYSGMSKRKDSLTLCITTAGFNIESVGFSQSVYAKKVATGDVEDEQFFSAVYTLDEGDYIFDPTVWIKANPGYGDSVDPHSFEAKAKKAQEEASDIPNFKVKHLNMWLADHKAFFDTSKWDACADPTLKIEDFIGQTCVVGVDLASKVDLTSIGYIFKRDGIFYLFDKSYIPEQTVKDKRNVLYDNCIAGGYLICTPGEAIHYPNIGKELVESSKKFKISECLYDPWNATSFSQDMGKERINMVEFRFNTANLSEPTKHLDALIRQGKIRHNGSPLLRWCLGNVVCKYDAADNVFPRKDHESLKIDPIIALIMALASWMQKDQKVSTYESRGLRFL